MDVETIREYCLSKPYVIECMPFDEDTLVFKVCDKMFALLSLDSNGSINLKCDPELAISLREEYPFVQPGYHMNKMHWNTVFFSELSNFKLLCEWIDHSYWLVVSKMSKQNRLKIEKAI